ncbi:unnamed protein product [Protopolystoma xenopodis]|uniref:Uncharacterized protein n=1 Tax=Protopolystoma xenopodis TaxID=117903 RepID=A0A448X659_9PLAT|nr:unnamed protein product [Protopolystoma xenopodis]
MRQSELGRLRDRITAPTPPKAWPRRGHGSPPIGEMLRCHRDWPAGECEMSQAN